jgi:large subunit ribosomal protein L5
MSTRNLTINDFDKRFTDKVRPTMTEVFKYRNINAVPKLEKIVVNAGIGSITKGDKKKIASIFKDMTMITGQKPIQIKAKKAIAGFSIRADSVVGMKVTLRNKMMTNFFNRFCMVTLPRIRDFRGINQKNFDKCGSLSYGVKEQIVFPEIKPEESLTNFGLQISFKTTAKNKTEAVKLLKELGMPIIEDVKK